MHIISDEAVNLLRHNARSVVRELGLLNDAYFDIGVTLAERHLLIELSTCLYPTVGDIAERLLLDKSTASRLIAKAVKKGYIKYSTDENDRRKRHLQMTEKGKKTLNAFEPIAFLQTKQALLTLSKEEIEMVYQGIDLYARGLKRSRLQNKITIAKVTLQDNATIAHLFSKRPSDDVADIYTSYRKKGCCYLVMKMDGKVIAGIGIAPIKNSSCLIEKICFLPEMSDGGFEKMLINFAIKEAKKLGYLRCYLNLSEDLPFKIDYFQELGFRLLKEHKKRDSYGKLARDL